LSRGRFVLEKADWLCFSFKKSKRSFRKTAAHAQAAALVRLPGGFWNPYRNLISEWESSKRFEILSSSGFAQIRPRGLPQPPKVHHRKIFWPEELLLIGG
jgi:hypothetical protein